LDVKDAAEMLKKVALLSLARALASMVFPLPGGPYSNRPRTGARNPWKMSARKLQQQEQHAAMYNSHCGSVACLSMLGYMFSMSKVTRYASAALPTALKELHQICRRPCTFFGMKANEVEQMQPIWSMFALRVYGRVWI
jgi:hypothetical protein